MDTDSERITRAFDSVDFELVCEPDRPLRVREIFRAEGSDLWLTDASGVIRLMDLAAQPPARPCSLATSTRSVALGASASALLVASGEPDFVAYPLATPSSRVGGVARLHRHERGAGWLLHTFEGTGGSGSLAQGDDGATYTLAATSELA